MSPLKLLSASDCLYVHVLYSIPVDVCSQAECDELAQRADALKEENATLRSEVNRIRSEYDQLLSENAALKVMLKS